MQSVSAYLQNSNDRSVYVFSNTTSLQNPRTQLNEQVKVLFMITMLLSSYVSKLNETCLAVQFLCSLKAIETTSLIIVLLPYTIIAD